MLVAVSVNEKGEPVVSGGWPVSAPVVVFNEAHDGNEPVKPKVGAGEPVAVAVNVPAVVTAKVVLAALVNTGACVTVSVAGVLVAAEPMPLFTTTRN